MSNDINAAIRTFRDARRKRDEWDAKMEDARAVLASLVPEGESVDTNLAKVTHTAPYTSVVVDTAKVRAVRGWEEKYGKAQETRGSVRVTLK